MNRRCGETKTKTIGSLVTAEPAIVCGQFTVFLRESRVSPTGRVLLASLSAINRGHRKSFHALRNTKVTRVAIAGDGPQHQPLAHSIYPDRLDQAVVDPCKELPQKEDAEDLHDRGQDNARFSGTSTTAGPGRQDGDGVPCTATPTKSTPRWTDAASTPST
jgi:hypothetical protein